MFKHKSIEDNADPTGLEKAVKITAVGALVVSTALWASRHLVTRQTLELVHGQPERTVNQLPTGSVNNKPDTEVSIE